MAYKEDDVDEALSWFEKSSALDPRFQWSKLFRAHAPHDLERWGEAAEAYDAVDPAFFVGARVWRYALLLEQRALCLLLAGDRERATREFLGVIKRWPHIEPIEVEGQYLIRAARGELRAELFAPARAFFESRKEDFEWQLRELTKEPSNPSR